MSGRNDGEVKISVSDDGMKAFAEITPPGPGGKSVTLADLERALSGSGVVYGLVDAARMTAGVRNGSKRHFTFIVATGDKPQRGEDASIKLVYREKERQGTLLDTHKVDLRELGTVVSVGPGEVVAEKHPPTYGAPGFTVTGRSVPGKPGRNRHFSCGPNTITDSEHSVFRAEKYGVPEIRDTVVGVSPTFEVRGNVDYSVGNIDFKGTVIIHGDVRDGFTVKARGDVYIQGHVEAAKVIAGGDVKVAGGIITRFGGYVAAEGSVMAKHITNSIVEAEGNIVSFREITNSFVRSNGFVTCIAGEGRIAGGDIMAMKGISARQLGAPKETSTVLRAGFNFKSHMVIQELEQRIVQIKATLRDADKYVNYSSSPRAETLTKLEDSVPSLKREEKILREEIRALEAAAPLNTDAMISCENVAHGGVTVFIGESSKRIPWKMRNVTLKLDEDLHIKVEILHERRSSRDRLNAYRDINDPALQSGAMPMDRESASVLVLDASEESRDKLKGILYSSGFNVAGETGNAYDAVHLYTKYVPEIVVVDLASTGEKGLGAIVEILGADPDASIVLSIGLCDTDQMRRAVEAGASHFMLKPYYRKNVVDTLRRALANRPSEQADAAG